MELKVNIYFAAALIWTILITVLSLVSFQGIDLTDNPVPDKAVHGVFYAIFTVLWYLFLKRKKIKYLLLKIFLFSFMYGTIIEVLQGVMPLGRNFDIKDILANATGALTGVILIKIYLISTGIALKRKN